MIHEWGRKGLQVEEDWMKTTISLNDMIAEHEMNWAQEGPYSQGTVEWVGVWARMVVKENLGME